MPELVLFAIRLLAQASLGKLSTNERQASIFLDQREWTRLAVPEYLYEGVDLARLRVPVEQPAHDPELGEGGDQPEGGDQGQRPVLQDELLQLGETVGGEDVVQQEVGEEISLRDLLVEGDEYGLEVGGATNQISEDVII